MNNTLLVEWTKTIRKQSDSAWDALLASVCRPFTVDSNCSIVSWNCIYTHIHIWLVVSTPLKNIRQLGLLFPIWENKKCSKPPTRYTYICIYDDIEILMRPLIKKAWSKVLTSVLLLPFPQKLLLQRQAMNYHRF